MGAYESGQAFIAGVLAKLPTEQQAQARKIFEDAAAKEAVTVIGDSTLARSDYSRQMDELKQKEEAMATRAQALEEWFGVNKPALEEYVRIKPEYDGWKAGGGNPTPNPNPLTPKPAAAYDPEESRKIAMQVVDDAGRDYINIAAWMAAKSVAHLHTFGEPLPAIELVNNPKLGKPVAGQPGRVFSLEDAYTEKYHDKLAAKAKEVDDKRIDTEVQRRLGEERAKHGNLPYPLRTEASVLDLVNDTNNKPNTYTVDTAVAEYERLAAQRSA